MFSTIFTFITFSEILTSSVENVFIISPYIEIGSAEIKKFKPFKKTVPVFLIGT